RCGAPGRAGGGTGGRLCGVRDRRAARATAVRWRPGGAAQAVAGRPERGAAQARGNPRTLNSATRLVLVLGQVRAELAQRVAGKFRVLLGEVVAFPARQFIVLEIQGQGLDLDRATAVDALAGRIVPALG